MRTSATASFAGPIAGPIGALLCGLLLACGPPPPRASTFAIGPGNEPDFFAALEPADLPDGCAFVSASVRQDHVDASYRCERGESRVVVRHPSAARDGAIVTERFAVETDGAPDLAPDLAREVAASLEAHSDFAWIELDAPPTRGGAALEAEGVALHIARDPRCAWLWIAVPLGLIVLIIDARQALRRRWALLAATLVGALLIRWIVPWTVANYYTDIIEPWGTRSPAMVPRRLGLHALYAALDHVVAFDATGILALQACLGALAVVVVVFALCRSGFERAAPFAAGLLSVDAMQARLAASDAIHVPALLAWAVGLGLFVSPAPPARWWIRSLLLAFLAALPGLARGEMALTPLVWLVFAMGDRSPAARRAYAWAPVLAGVGLAVFVAATQFAAGMAETPTLARALSWLETIAGLLRGDEGSDWIQAWVVQLALLGVLASAARRDPQPAALLAVAVAVHAGRALTAMAGAGPIGALAYARHEIVLGVVLLCLAGLGLATLVDAARGLRESRGAERTKRLGWIAAALALAVLLPAAWPPYGETYAYQDELAFLDDALADVPEECAVITAGPAPSMPWPESSIALPHPLLSYDAPLRPWAVATTTDELDGMLERWSGSCAVVYEGSWCSLEPMVRGASDHDPCDRLHTTGAPLRSASIPARALLRPFVGERVPLALRQLSPE